MKTRRTAKVAEAVRQVVSSAVLFELRDPRVKNVTILAAEVASDLRTAKVFISVMGDEATQKLCLHGLNSARGFIQSQIADKLQLRLTPVLTFVMDDGIKKSIEISKMLKELEANDSESDRDTESDSTELNNTESQNLDSTDDDSGEEPLSE